MRGISPSIAVLGLVAVLGLCSCTSSDAGRPLDVPGGAATAACEVDVPASSALLPASGPEGRARGTVGVILPEQGVGSEDSLRRGTSLATALRREGLTPLVAYAAGDRAASVSLARSMLGDGVEVLLLGAVGNGAAVRIEDLAGATGVEVVEYGRVNLGGSAPYFVSLDYEEVGRLQAQTMLDCLAARGVTDPRVILVDGGTDVDQGAVLMAIGAHQVLDPLVSAGKVDLQQETTVTGWDLARAAAVFGQALEASDDRVDGVLAASDDIAGAVVGVLRKRALLGTVVTGQGSGTHGLRRVVTGEQSMTVLEDLDLEADAAARLAATLVSDPSPAPASLSLSPFADPLSPRRGLAGLWVPGRATTRTDLQDVVRVGAVTTDDLCRGILGECAALGVS